MLSILFLKYFHMKLKVLKEKKTGISNSLMRTVTESIIFRIFTVFSFLYFFLRYLRVNYMSISEQQNI